MRYDYRKYLTFDLLLLALGVTALFGICTGGIDPPVYHPVEGISLWSLLRTAEGKPYVSDIAEVPLSISAYSPHLNWLLTPFIKIFSLRSLHELTIAGRSLVAVFFLATVLLMGRLTRVQYPTEYRTRYFFLGLAWFLVTFPDYAVQIRPDFVSFLCEAAGFVLFYRYHFSEAHKSRSRYFYGSAVFLGLAASTKFNTIGVMAGLVLFLLGERRFLHALAYAVTWAAVVALNLGIAVLIEGDSVITNVLQATLNPPGSLADAAHIASTMCMDLVLKNFMFYFVVGIGLLVLHEKDRREGRLFFLALASSFLIASAGQLKPGAYYNYHFGFFMLSLCPFTLGMKAVLEPQPGTRLFSKMVRIFLTVSMLVRLSYSLRAESLALGEWGHYPHQAAREYVEKTFPAGFIYSSGEDAQLRLYPRALLSPWTEVFLQITPRFKRYLPTIRKRLVEKGGFTAAVVTGAGCETWKASGLFVEETKHLSKLQARFDRICVFSPP